MLSSGVASPRCLSVYAVSTTSDQQISNRISVSNLESLTLILYKISKFKYKWGARRHYFLPYLCYCVRTPCCRDKQHCRYVRFYVTLIDGVCFWVIFVDSSTVVNRHGRTRNIFAITLRNLYFCSLPALSFISIVNMWPRCGQLLTNSMTLPPIVKQGEFL